MTMNKRQTEYIALYLFVFGAILLFGVLARKFVLAQIFVLIHQRAISLQTRTNRVQYIPFVFYS